MCIRRCSPSFSILLIVSHPLRFISRPWRFSVMWFYLFILLFVCVRACSRRPFLLAYVLIMYLKTKPNMINLISSRQHGLIKGIIHLSSCFAAQTSFFFSPKTVRWPIMLPVVHSHPPKAHSEPGKTKTFLYQLNCIWQHALQPETQKCWADG